MRVPSGKSFASSAMARFGRKTGFGREIDWSKTTGFWQKPRAHLYGNKEMLRKFFLMGAAIEAELRALVAFHANKVVGRAKATAPRDTGALIESIGWDAIHHGLGALIYAAAPYAPHIEYGTEARVQSGAKMPPSSALAGWASRHGMAGAEFAIARAIFLRGTRPRPFLNPAVERQRPIMVTHTAKTVARFNKRIAKL